MLSLCITVIIYIYLLIEKKQQDITIISSQKIQYIQHKFNVSVDKLGL